MTIHENATPDVQTDFMKAINKIAPWNDGYPHSEGNSAAHLKTSMMEFFETLIVERGELPLGYGMEFTFWNTTGQEIAGHT